jgi:hypothetical protein
MPEKKHGLYWFDDWSITDPHDSELSDAMWTARHNQENLERNQLWKILRAAEDYCHFAGHPATTKSIIKQLRQVRRAVRDESER